MTTNKLNGNKLNRERSKSKSKYSFDDKVKVARFEKVDGDTSISKGEKRVKTISLLLTSIFIAIVIFITLMGVAYKNTIDTYIEYDKVYYEMYGETLSDK